MRYYVTLFDSNYLTRGLVLYRSLVRHANDFHLWIICFDDLAYELLQKLELKNVTLVSLEQFEDTELLRIKNQRTRQEYCWTCTPSTVLYVLNNYKYVEAVTYLDADLMFFSSPEPIFKEAGNASIVITEHRYLPEFDKSSTNGIYNVQFVTFYRDAEGLKAANWWRDRCNEWCYARCEDNKFGDQKYLDDWLDRFKRVHVVKNLGAGLAPWNAVRYSVINDNSKIMIEKDELIFYHFHQLSFHHLNIAYIGVYPTSNAILKLLYDNYLKCICQAYKDVRKIMPSFNGGIISYFHPYEPNLNAFKLLKNFAGKVIRRRYRLYG